MLLMHLMRTTVDLPDNLVRQAKAAAALEGKSLKSFLAEAVRARLQGTRATKSRGHRVRLPLVRSKRPGSLRITGDTVAKALEAEDRNPGRPTTASSMMSECTSRPSRR